MQRNPLGLPDAATVLADAAAKVQGLLHHGATEGTEKSGGGA